MLIFKNYNIADWFSFYRVLVAPLLVLLLWLDERMIFACFLFISYATDAIDGYLARKLKITSSRGSQLDSFGDQVTLIIGMIGLLYFEKDFVIANAVILIIAFIPYILQMLIAYLKYGKATAFHTYMAKISAVIQGLFILWSLVISPEYWLFYTMIIIGLTETIEEISLIFMLDKWASDVKGLFWAYRDKKRLKKIRDKGLKIL